MSILKGVAIFVIGTLVSLAFVGLCAVIFPFAARMLVCALRGA